MILNKPAQGENMHDEGRDDDTFLSVAVLKVPAQIDF